MSTKFYARLGLAFALSGAAFVALADPAALPQVLSQASVQSAHPDRGYLLSVAKAGERLVAVGEGGLVILSDDQGVTWRQAQTPVNVLLTQVRFATAQEGWAIGHLGVILHTADAGQTWQLQLDGMRAAQLFVDDAKREFARLGGEDEGAERALRQAQFLVEDGPDKPFLTMQIDDAQRISVFGAFGLALRSIDGGRSWAPLHAAEFNPGALHYYGSTGKGAHGLVVGEQGMLLRGRADGSYRVVEQPYPGTLFGVLTTDDAALAYGLRGNAVRSIDQGEYWQEVDTGVSASLQGGVVLSDGRVLLLAEDGQVAVGDSGAEHFQVINQRLLPATDAVQVGEDQLVLVGPRGVQTLKLAVAESAR